MPNATIFHNPRCSKSRQALQILNEHNVEVSIVEYLKHPLNTDEINALFQQLHITSAHDMIRPKEKEFNLAGLSQHSSNSDIFSAISHYPKLLERPIVVIDNKAIIGRPPENILALLG